MTPFSEETKAGEVLIRPATSADIPHLVALNRICYGDLQIQSLVWREGHLSHHLRTFGDGQLVAELDGEIVGGAASLIVTLEPDPLRPHTFAGITDGGFFHNHNPRGDTLYAVDTYVHPEHRRQGIGSLLYEGRRRLCRELNLWRMVGGGRLAGLAAVGGEVSPEEYLKRVEAGDLVDEVLGFHLRQGFVPRGVLHNYLSDPASGNCASFIEWLNPDYREPRDTDRKVRVACVQYQMRRVTSFDDFAAQVSYFVETAADYESDFVVFPEFFSVQLLSQIDALAPLEGIRRLSEYTEPFIELMGGLARRYGHYIIAGSHPILEGERLYNKSLIFKPDGSWFAQPKLHITPSERREWGISGGDELFLLQTPKAKIGVLICYDIEFPEAARYLADHGAEIIFVPYCTDNRQGYLRVRYCAQARAIENQVYIVTAGIIGNLPSVPAMDIHYGQAAVFTPSDFEFARDGIQAQADSNVETLLVTDLDIENLYRSRSQGSVTPRRDRRRDLFEITAKLRNLPRDSDVERSTPLDLPD
ncbi:MAG: GNAT family N-acetyltransferase [Puniceicoccaceae bacterium]|nr:MAG: GNAT family N-acetyltransferase [Puniceicoccaceae bacterium]